MKELRFSVIVPVYRQWHLVPQLLQCLAQQTLGQECFEVILVNDDCPAFNCPAGLPKNTRLIHCDSPGSFASRNYGAKHALGRFLAFTDADCLPCADWLERLSQTFGAQTVTKLVAGRVDTVSTATKPNLWEIFDRINGIPQAWYVSRGYAATANLSVSKQVFESVGEFDGGRFSGGDADFCRRAFAQGHPLTYCACACVVHPARSSWSAISTKARRLKGGQLLAGSPKSRRRWLIRAFIPPMIGAKRFLSASREPISHRFLATLVLFVVWGIGLMEVVRLLLRGRPERE
tara:strand:+ start:478 stop:1347 length:870 start_codon:yes stop_codon:yes gene_type:complete